MRRTRTPSSISRERARGDRPRFRPRGLSGARPPRERSVQLLDSLEAIDSARIAELVEYFADYAEHLVVALLPEDAQALDDDFNRITSI